MKLDGLLEVGVDVGELGNLCGEWWEGVGDGHVFGKEELYCV